MAAAGNKSKGSQTTALSARLLELSHQTNDPQPYEVLAGTLVVPPPTRTRRTAMNNAEQTLYVLRSLLAGALNRATVGGPAPLPDDATDEQRAALADAVAEWKTATAAAQAQVSNLNDQIASANEDYERAFFGPVYAEVMEYFEDKPNLWDLFIPDIQAEFLPPAPDNGVCPTCGRVDDEEAAERAPKSLTSSTTTGTT